ncbi:class I SAM-dependent methyltransferase [Pseudomonas sp. LPB0260]|uniref:class I SAM-dependent methyltransferase n=1 Tax=Pseudomonas sp. LPB0260 TaxID=2614442 RepID=UPI0015C1E6B1|nr:class I SAM-dependent methyltransferase [Pseudomonas sp. LPB0260]QLC73565.1 class I SAM-dependent methyltransferase [Pseudomonas sp. LPB0260]QLC76339.1 class I SAM-dependent methyltransferase [Pseudomonas sp. LPB0260]
MGASVIGNNPALRALLAQLLATLLVGGGIYLAAQLSDWRAPWLLAGLLQGLLAASLGSWLGLARWWWWLNLLFVPAVLLSSGASLPSWVFFLAFLLVLLLNWNSLVERVPLYLSGARCQEQLVALLATRPADFRFVDLGCGPAGTLLHLARRFPAAQFVGVETAPLTFAIAWLRCLPQRNCRVRYASLWRTDLSRFEVVYCFLSPAPMAALWDKARAQMKADAWLISNSFEVPGVAADRSIELHDWRESRLLLWRMGGEPGASSGE